MNIPFPSNKGLHLLCHAIVDVTVSSLHDHLSQHGSIFDPINPVVAIDVKHLDVWGSSWQGLKQVKFLAALS